VITLARLGSNRIAAQRHPVCLDRLTPQEKLKRTLFFEHEDAIGMEHWFAGALREARAHQAEDAQ
jgi:hypothetical protein